MASTNVDFGKYSEMQEYVQKAKLKMTEAIDDIWCKNFANLYNNFITNGFLDDLYKDAESKYKLIFTSSASLICGCGSAIAGTAAATGATVVELASITACISVPVWIITAIILGLLSALGIRYVVIKADDITFKYDAKNTFIKLLESCYKNEEANYLALDNDELKLEKAILNLQTILFKIDAYQKQYADLSASLDAFGLKAQVAGDGTTITGIETTVTVNGKEVPTTVSDAMNAFYTYTEVAMSTEIEADYIERTYGVEVDYDQVMKNAAEFSQETIESGLYSHEFVDELLPEYVSENPDVVEDAKKKAAETAGYSTDDFSSILSGISGIGGAAAAVAALLGRTNYTGITPDPNGIENPSTDTPSTPSSGTPSTPSSETPTSETPTSETPTSETPTTETPTVTPPEITEITDVTLPDGDFESEFEKDYDELAREWYEEMSSEELAARRMNIINLVNQQFDNNDLDGLRATLVKYGYEDAYIDTILADRELVINAMLVGDTNYMIADKAISLAKADGVDNFDSKFDEPAKYSDLVDGSATDILVDVKGSKEVTDAKTAMKEAETAYNDKLTETNDALKTVRENKTNMEDIKAKYDKEFGEDTSKWSEEAVKEYNESISKFNESVETYNTKNQELATAKDTYSEKITTFKEARETYIKSVRTQNSINVDTDSGASGGAEVGGASIGITDVDEIFNPTTTSGSGNSDGSDSDGSSGSDAGSIPDAGSSTGGSSVGTSDDDVLGMLG